MNQNKPKKKIKLTIMDLAIVAIIIAAILGVNHKFSKAKAAIPFAGKIEKIQVSFFIEETPDFTIDSIKIGDPAKESVQSSSFGKVTEINLGDSVSWAKSNTGEFVSSCKEGYYSATIIMEANGLIGNGGSTIDKSIYYVGQTITLYVGNSIFLNGRISDIKKIDI